MKQQIKIFFLLIILLIGFMAFSLITACAEKESVAKGQENIAGDKSELTDTAKQPEVIEEPKQNIAEEQGAQETTQEQKIDKRRALYNDFVALNQSPELATGCEITSLTALLNYYGLPANKLDLSDNYLSKAPVGSADPWVTFVGNPRDDSSYGCYAPVIVNTANNYLSAQGSALRANDLSGAQFRSLFSYIDQGIPVIVWATRFLEEGHFSVTWNVGGKSITWFTPEHCLVLVGYDLQNGTVTVADPLVGSKVDYDLALFESRYNDLFTQAVIVQ